MPTETAVAILAEVKEAFPGSPTPGLLQHSREIFESLNARPPRWWAAIVLFLVYAGSFLTALVAMILVTAGSQGSLSALLSRIRETKTEIRCQDLSTWRGANFAAGSSNKTQTLVAITPKAATAKHEFQNLIQRLPAESEARLFGNVILTRFTGGTNESAHWLSELRLITTNVFIEETNDYAILTLTTVAKDERIAGRLESEAAAYIEIGPLLPIRPPWDSTDSITDPERLARHRARETYLRLIHVFPEQTSEMRDLARVLAGAREDNSNEVKSAQAKLDQLQTAARRQEQEKLRADSTSNDVAVVDLYLKITDAPPTNELWAAQHPEFVKLLGALPAEGESAGMRAETGFVTRKGKRLRVDWLRFHSLFDGGPALAKWLCENGCSKIAFQIDHENLRADE